MKIYFTTLEQEINLLIEKSPYTKQRTIKFCLVLKAEAQRYTTGSNQLRAQRAKTLIEKIDLFLRT